MKTFKTQHRLDLEREWSAIFADYQRLRKLGGQKMPIYHRLGQKYGKHYGTIGRIVKQMERKAA